MTRDPLTGLQEKGRVLFQQLASVSVGFGRDDVMDAALNLVLNALRQGYDKRKDVEARFDELFGRAKQNLLNFYDPVSGRRRTTIPYDQHIIAPLHIEPDKIRGK